jgi:energy-coupling factor transport system ATP-binding protein
VNKETAIETRNLFFSYRPPCPLIEALNLTVFQGEAVALLGPNGAGKSTLGLLLTGILKPSSGQLFVFGEERRDLPLCRIAQRIGYCFQNPDHQLLAVSVEEEIGFGLKYSFRTPEYIAAVSKKLLNLFEIEHLSQVFPLHLSWGEKRRVVIAACLALEPDFLILDEPTNGLDEKQIVILSRVLGSLREQGIGMLLISHDHRFAHSNAERILLMEEGKISRDYYL